MAETIAPHGTRARYEQRGGPCRCQSCRDANARYVRAWRTAAAVDHAQLQLRLRAQA